MHCLYRKCRKSTICRILNDSGSDLAKKLTKHTRTCFSFSFTIPRIHREKFKQNSVNKALRKLRDSVADLYTTDCTVRTTRQRHTADEPREATITKPTKSCQYCGKGGFVVPKIHENQCIKNPNSAKGKLRTPKQPA